MCRHYMSFLSGLFTPAEVVPNKASGSGGRSAGKAQAAKPRPEIREVG